MSAKNLPLWRKRTKIMPVRMAESEWDEAKQTAKQQGCRSVSELVRWLLVKAKAWSKISKN